MYSAKTPEQVAAMRARTGAGVRNLNEEVALLPTPAVNDMGAGKTVEQWDESTDAMRARHGNGNGHGPSLAIEAQRLLPTATAQDAPSPSGENPAWGHGVTLTDAARSSVTDFGPYAAAVARWEQVIGRPAPPPTEPGNNDRPRLAPRFVEFLMGFPDGWVTDPALGIPRAAQLKALGNGIVPQQAALALRLLLDGVAS